MSGLGHYLESEGLATTGVSLIREHAESSRPPRTLCVPFDFGHPFGSPGAVALQTDVLRQALDLFERSEGPVLEDWVGEGGDAAEHPDGSAEPWSCPIPAGQAATAESLSGDARLAANAQGELARLLPWYDHALSERGRTTVGASGLAIPELLPFIIGFLDGAGAKAPVELDVPVPIALKAACEDLKQIYLEAASAQPVAEGAQRPSHAQQNDWFWRETEAAELLREVGGRIRETEDPTMGMVAQYLLIPHARPEPRA